MLFICVKILSQKIWVENFVWVLWDNVIHYKKEKFKNRIICKFYVVKSLLDGWVGGWKLDGWVGGWESGFKDCLQQPKNDQLPVLSLRSL